MRVVSKCAHQFHRACVEELLLSHMAEDTLQARGEGQDGRWRAEVARCPACGDALSVDMRPQPAGFRSRKKRAGKSLLGKIGAHELPTSTKLEAVAAEIRAMMTRGNGSKAVIFSQYTRMLDLLTIRLSGDGVGVARISGDMTRQQRDVNLDAFRRHNTTRVIMISLKAGGEGLNLQNADHIFVVDPWWNPAAELQAIDRVHRIGQTKRVTAIRFIIKDSIEERIVQLQDKKKLVMAGALDGDTAAMQQLTAQVVVTVVFALLCNTPVCVCVCVCAYIHPHPHALSPPPTHVYPHTHTCASPRTAPPSLPAKRSLLSCPSAIIHTLAATPWAHAAWFACECAHGGCCRVL